MRVIEKAIADRQSEIFDFLDAEPRLDYVVAMAKNAVLQRHAESAMQVARAQSEVGGETAHVYTDTRYAASTWDHERRVVIKAEVVRLGDREPRDNPRFVVTVGVFAATEVVVFNAAAGSSWSGLSRTSTRPGGCGGCGCAATRMCASGCSSRRPVATSDCCCAG